MDYHQPNFYHFNDDSLWLARSVIQREVQNQGNILDICSGCGIVGIEVFNALPASNDLFLLEGQSEFLPYLRKNIQEFSKDGNISIINTWLGDYKGHLEFDLIVSNPPYFKKGAGRASPDTRRQICRTFEVDDHHSLILFFKNHLAKGGRAYFLSPKEMVFENCELLDLKEEIGLFLYSK